MSCNTTLPTQTLPAVELDVAGKFQQITELALATDSIYMRAKDTFKELFDGKKINEAEYAQYAAQFISGLASATTQSAMQLALEWAKEEYNMPYGLASVKAQTELTQANREKVKEEICLTQTQVELQQANITATLSASMRDNGRVLTYGSNGYTPLSLRDEGTKFSQINAVNAQKYSTLADAYRKSGVVTLATTADGEVKGTSGDSAGYTKAQESFALRQVKSFEDSKRNHSANAMSQMIGQMLSAEVAPADADITRWRTAIDYLNTNTP